ncbi:MAG TPA: hypothetical protein VIY86_07355, partial [Pirellulaceae bacterium]
VRCVVRLLIIRGGVRRGGGIRARGVCCRAGRVGLCWEEEIGGFPEFWWELVVEICCVVGVLDGFDDLWCGLPR